MARPQITKVPGYERGELKGTEAPLLAQSIRAELAKIQRANPNTDTVRVTAPGVYVAQVQDRTILVDTTAGAITIQLPSATKRLVLPYTVAKTSSDANAVTILPATGEQIAGGASLAWTEENQAYTLHPDGVDRWWLEGLAATVLAEAEAYADAGDVATLASANAHSDAHDATTLAAAEAYTDAHHAWADLTGVPANISVFAALVGSADKLSYFTGLGALALTALTTYGRTIIACANAAAARTALGLGTLATLSAVTETEITLADVVTDNVSTTKHGFAPKLPNDATKYLDGTGAYSVPAGGGGGGTTITTYDPATASHAIGDILRYRRNLYQAAAAIAAAGSTVDTTHALYTSAAGIYPMYEGAAGPKNLIDSVVGTLAGSTLPVWDGANRMLLFKGGVTLASYVQLYAASAGAGMAAMTGGAFTLWAKIIWFGGTSGIAERSDGNTINSGFQFGLSSAGNPMLLIERATGNLTKVASVPVPQFQAAHVCVTYSGSATAAGVTFYIDGVAQGTATSSDGSGTVGTNDIGFPFRLGNTSFTSGGFTQAGSFNGKILAFYAWKGRALSAAEVLSMQTSPLLPNLPPNTAKWTALTGGLGGEE